MKMRQFVFTMLGSVAFIIAGLFLLNGNLSAAPPAQKPSTQPIRIATAPSTSPSTAPSTASASSTAPATQQVAAECPADWKDQVNQFNKAHMTFPSFTQYKVSEPYPITIQPFPGNPQNKFVGWAIDQVETSAPVTYANGTRAEGTKVQRLLILRDGKAEEVEAKRINLPYQDQGVIVTSPFPPTPTTQPKTQPN